MKLLVLEDDSVSRMFLSETLAAAGHQVCALGDGLEALERAQRHRYDVLLLDLNVPGLAGDQLLAALRAGSANPAAPLASAYSRAILLSADMDQQRRAAMLAAGFADVLMKPIAADALLAVVEATAQRSNSPALAVTSADLWDEAAALAMTGGIHATVVALRGLLLGELPAQKRRLELAFAAGDTEVAAAELHRLRAACGFCGAAQLGLAARQASAVLAARQTPDTVTINTLLAACDRVIQSAEDTD